MAAPMQWGGVIPPPRPTRRKAEAPLPLFSPPPVEAAQPPPLACRPSSPQGSAVAAPTPGDVTTDDALDAERAALIARAAKLKPHSQARLELEVRLRNVTTRLMRRELGR
jgi:hypothetical protein